MNACAPRERAEIQVLSAFAKGLRVQARSWCDDNVMTLRKHHDHDSDARQRVHIPVRLSIMSRQAIPRCDPGTLLNQCRLHETKKYTMQWSRGRSGTSTHTDAIERTKEWLRLGKRDSHVYNCTYRQLYHLSGDIEFRLLGPPPPPPPPGNIRHSPVYSPPRKAGSTSGSIISSSISFPFL